MSIPVVLPVPPAASDRGEEPVLDPQVCEAALRYRARSDTRRRRSKLRRNGLWLQLDSPERIAKHVVRSTPDAALPLSAPEVEKVVEAQSAVPAATLHVALERIMGGSNDLQPFSAYLDRALRAGRAVGRIRIRTPAGDAYGTGFLVSPDLLLTNHHVLPDEASARDGMVQFGVERGIDGAVRSGAAFHLAPDAFFLANPQLDYALVALSGTAAERSDLGALRLDGTTGKVIIDQFVSIIGHPAAGEKQVALRQNRLLDVLPDFLHYETDTMPGASGSPVFNDRWEVVALHHSGVPATDSQGRILALDGTPWEASRGESDIRWVANEGIRVSRIVASLLERRSVLPLAWQSLLDQAISAAQSPASPADASPGRQTAATVPHPTTSTTRTEAMDSHGQTDPSPLSSPTIQLRAGPDDRAVLPVPRTGDGVATLSIPTDAAVEFTIRVSPQGSVEAKRAASVPPMSIFAPRVTESTAGFPRTSLIAGDVLLYKGRGIISKGIMYFTNSNVSHASLYLGDGTVGEALGSGLKKRNLDESFADHDFVTVRRLTSPTETGPVVGRGEFYLQQGLKYSYQQIVLLALLLLIRKVKPSGVVGKLIMAAAQAGAAALNDLLHGGKQLMICSEFVYRAYDEASDATPDPYGLSVPAIAGFGAESVGGARIRIHPESVLARLATHPTAFAAVRPQESWLAPSATDSAMLEREVEPLLEQHLREVQGGAPATPTLEILVSQPGEQEVAESVARFAAALDAVLRSGTMEKDESIRAAAAESLIPSHLPAPVAALFKVPADFVTPADLMNTSSLQTLGNVFP